MSSGGKMDGWQMDRCELEDMSGMGSQVCLGQILGRINDHVESLDRVKVRGLKSEVAQSGLCVER